MAGEILGQVQRIDHRHHGVEACHIRQAVAGLVAEIEGRGNRQRLGDAGAFDQQIVKAPLLGQLAHALQQVVAQRAADAAIGHLDQLFLGPVQLGAFADQIGVDVHLGHVVDDDRDATSFAIVQDMVQQRGLSGPQKAGKDGDGQALIAGRLAGWHGSLAICNVITLLNIDMPRAVQVRRCPFGPRPG